MAPRGAPPTPADHVIAVVSRETLNLVLSALHRAGFGPQTRVIDGARDDATAQLRRAGLNVQDESNIEPDAMLIVVTAPGRTVAVSALLAELGADAVVFAARRAEAPVADAPLPLLTPDIRIGGEAAGEPH